MWESKLNRLLPPDIQVAALGEAAPNFHAVRSAVMKTYVYRLHLGSSPASPFERWCRTAVPDFLVGPLGSDPAVLQAVAQTFVGDHDFAAYRRPDPSRPNMSTRRTIYRADVVDEGDGRCRLEFAVSGALFRMIRCIVGCVLAVASGRMPLKEAQTALADPSSAGATRWEPASAQGLCLERVHFSPTEEF